MNFHALRPDERTGELPPLRHLSPHQSTSRHSLAASDWGHDQEEADPVFSISFSEGREIVGFPMRAIRRHRIMSLLLFSTMVSVATVATLLAPRHFLVETKILAQPNFVMPALNNPRRAVPSESDAPTRLAVEAIMKQDNLTEIIRETNLLAMWSSTRSTGGRLKDFLLDLVGRPLSKQDRMDATVGLLRRRLWVRANEGTVTIGVDWVDPVTAFRITQSAQQNFFEQRHASEIAMIGESIAILEGHVTESQNAIQEALAQLKLSGGMRRSSRALVAPLVPSVALSPNAEQIAALQTSLLARRQTIADLESARSQRVAALQTTLAELRNNYGPAHPQVVSTQANIRALSSDSPQLTALRNDEASLTSQLLALGARPGEAAHASQPDPSLSRLALESLARSGADTSEDPQVTYAKSRLKIATSDYEDMLQRLEAARIELETARAAFKYRYNVVTPPQLPTSANKPRIPLLIATGVLLAAVITLFAAATLDLASGRLFESWQVRRQVGLPVIAHVPIA